MSRLDDFMVESERRRRVNAYLARKERERKELAGCIALLLFYSVTWLAGTALIAWVLSFTVGRLAWWQWCLVVFVVGVAAGRVASWFKRGEAAQ